MSGGSGPLGDAKEGRGVEGTTPGGGRSLNDPLPVEAPRITYDKYGFLSSDPRATPKPASREAARAQARLVNRRLGKWRDMLGKWDSFSRHSTSANRKLKSRVRKGIPDGIRGSAWQKMALSSDLPGKFPGVYDSLVRSPPGEMDEIIERDIHRTFPQHVIFRGGDSPGQASLFNVLKAYSSYDEEVGYCQGMGFVTALFLMYMAEEEAFWLLVQLMKNYNMQFMYAPGLPQLQVCLHQFEKLFAELLPRLHAHFERENVPVSMYASQWFLTITLYSLPFETALRVWDCFLFDGVKVVFRIGLAMLRACEDEFLAADFEGILGIFGDYPREKLEPDEILETAFGFSFTRQRLAELETEYRQQQGDLAR